MASLQSFVARSKMDFSHQNSYGRIFSSPLFNARDPRVLGTNVVLIGSFGLAYPSLFLFLVRQCFHGQNYYLIDGKACVV
jgi:hypothetical protein